MLDIMALQVEYLKEDHVVQSRYLMRACVCVCVCVCVGGGGGGGGGVQVCGYMHVHGCGVYACVYSYGVHNYVQLSYMHIYMHLRCACVCVYECVLVWRERKKQDGVLIILPFSQQTIQCPPASPYDSMCCRGPCKVLSKASLILALL